MPSDLAVEVISELGLSRLARDIARELKPLEIILEQSKISSEQFDRIKDNPFFHQRLIEEAQVWSGTTRQNLRERISVKAAVAVEELLKEAIDMVQDRKLGGQARITALQFIAKLGLLGEGATKEDSSGKVTINIMIGNQKLSFDKEAMPQGGPIIEGEVTPEVTSGN